MKIVLIIEIVVLLAAFAMLHRALRVRESEARRFATSRAREIVLPRDADPVLYPVARG